jgi:hypothetical protein
MGQTTGLILAAILVFMAGWTVRSQFKIFAQLRSPDSMADEDRRYLTKRSRGRIVNSIFILILGGMLAWTYLSGNEQRAEEIGQKNEAARNDPNIPRVELSEEERAFMKFYIGYWIAFLLILFIVFTHAILDFWATRRYAVNEMKRIRDDQKVLLERDLAMYRQQKRDRMARRANEE